MKLQDYLLEQVSEGTAKNYLFEITKFINYLGRSKSEQAGYEQVLDYLLYLRNRYDNPRTIHRIIQALKQYYFYLIEIDIRSTHPCRYLKIRDQSRGDIQVQDLLNEKEMHNLLSRKYRYHNIKIRNDVIMSLLVYQALRVKEMVNLKVNHINLQLGQIQILETPKTNGRILSLKASQILLFKKYLDQDRKQLLKIKSESLLITSRGTAEKGEGIHYLVQTFRPQFPTKKLTPTTIRQSVIAQFLKSGMDLRVVQVFAGHKKASTTEKYRQTNLEELKAAVQRYHPLS